MQILCTLAAVEHVSTAASFISAQCRYINQSIRTKDTLSELLTTAKFELLGEKHSRGDVPRELIRYSLFYSFLAAVGGL